MRKKDKHRKQRNDVQKNAKVQEKVLKGRKTPRQTDELVTTQRTTIQS